MPGILFPVFLLLFSCGNKKTEINPFAAITRMVDSVECQVGKSSLHAEETEEDTLPRPTEADGLFDDFIFNYAQDRVLQRQRTVFPLPYRRQGERGWIGREDWQHDSLFIRDACYALLFDREEDMEIVEDTALVSVKVDKVNLLDGTVSQYHFGRMCGVWMLDSVDICPVGEREGGDFLRFYAGFVSDSLFQRNHICEPLSFVTIDPDDEFSILETTLDMEQWYAFRPALPARRLSMIDYGQADNPLSRHKILKVNGVGNGRSNVFYFRKQGKEWELYKYEDTSM